MLLLLLALAGCAGAGYHTMQPAAGISLEYLGEATFPTGYEYAGTQVGGLSGIDYDAGSQRYVVISDDRAEHGPVRYYEAEIELVDGRLDDGDVVFTSVTIIRDKDGAPFAQRAVDPEAVRIAPGGLLWWVSEGDARTAPSVRVMDRSGKFLAEYLPPPYYNPTARAGSRDNKAFESLAFSHDGRLALTATENALKQDGPAATLKHGSPVRVLALDAATGSRQAEYIYVTEPVVEAARPASGLATNGLVELLAFDDHRFIALERSYSSGGRNVIRMFLTRIDTAVDVAGLKSIVGSDIRTMPKQLLLNLDDLGIEPDNIEGMTFGPPLADGSRTLILVSDNNFNESQVTQFLALRIKN